MLQGKIMNKVIFTGMATFGTLLCCVGPVSAQLITYSNPDTSWISQSKRFNIVGPLDSSISSFTDGLVMVTLDDPGVIGKLGYDALEVWGASPFSSLSRGEKALSWNESTDLHFSKSLQSFGFEAQIGDFTTPYDLNLQFYNGSVLVGSIVRTIDNTGVMTGPDGWDPSQGGARLFAGSLGTGFTSVRILSTGEYGFSAAGFRYNALDGTTPLAPGAVPEPGEWAAFGTLGIGLFSLVFRARRRFTK